MSKTSITIRADKALRDALAERAADQNTTISEVVRTILEQALLERPLASRVGHLRGSLELEQPTEPWRQQLRKHNWRP